MARLQRIEDVSTNIAQTTTDATPSTEWEELEDGSRAIVLSQKSNLIRVVLREMIGEDVEAIDKMPEGQVGIAMRLVTRLCTQWGDKPGVTLPELRKLNVPDLRQVTRLAESFLSQE